MSPVLLNPSRFGAPASAFQTLVAALPNLEAYWKADENPGGAGVTAADSSGHGRDGTYLAGTAGTAASLLADGTGRSLRVARDSGQGITVVDAAWMDMANISVGFLVKLTDATIDGNGDAFVSRYTSGGGFNWVLGRFSPGNWTAQVRNTGATVVNAVGGSVTLNQTYLAGFTYDGSNVRLWIDGVNTATQALSGSLQTGSSPIEVGRYSQTAATTPGADIDEIFITSGVLSGTDWSALQAAR